MKNKLETNKVYKPKWQTKTNILTTGLKISNVKDL